MENNKDIIYNFLNRFEDFAGSDKERGYIKAYRPSWHPNPVQFWFNPPYKDGKSDPTPSNCIFLTRDGKILVENFYTGELIDLDNCLGHSIENFTIVIEDYNLEESL